MYSARRTWKVHTCFSTCIVENVTFRVENVTFRVEKCMLTRINDPRIPIELPQLIVFLSYWQYIWWKPFVKCSCNCCFECNQGWRTDWEVHYPLSFPLYKHSSLLFDANRKYFIIFFIIISINFWKKHLLLVYYFFPSYYSSATLFVHFAFWLILRIGINLLIWPY